MQSGACQRCGLPSLSPQLLPSICLYFSLPVYILVSTQPALPCHLSQLKCHLLRGSSVMLPHQCEVAMSSPTSPFTLKDVTILASGLLVYTRACHSSHSFWTSPFLSLKWTFFKVHWGNDSIEYLVSSRPVKDPGWKNKRNFP